MRRVVCMLGIIVLGAVPLMFAGSPAGAQITPPPSCDFLTGGGFITNAAPGDPLGSHANFGVGGGCKANGPNAPFWGHLEYIDHGMGLNVHGTSITAYFFADSNTRLICGTARTNMFGDVNFGVEAADNDRAGAGPDQFEIQLTDSTGSTVFYSTFLSPFFPHFLQGGDIVLHNPNPSTITGAFGGSCPALNILPN